MKVEVEFYSKSQLNRLKNDNSWLQTEVREIYDYKEERVVHAYHRIFGDIKLVFFPASKRQIWTFIGTSEIPKIDDYEVPIKVFTDKKRFKEYVMHYVTKVLKSRIRAL